jgi:hypothetical protein
MNAIRIALIVTLCYVALSQECHEQSCGSHNPTSSPTEELQDITQLPTIKMSPKRSGRPTRERRTDLPSEVCFYFLLFNTAPTLLFSFTNTSLLKTHRYPQVHQQTAVSPQVHQQVNLPEQRGLVIQQ